MFVTIDPARDTPKVVGEFTHAFSNDLLGLTGTAEIRVRSEPILVTLVPALRQWLPAVSLDPLRAAAAAVGRWIGGTGGAHAGA